MKMHVYPELPAHQIYHECAIFVAVQGFLLQFPNCPSFQTSHTSIVGLTAHSVKIIRQSSLRGLIRCDKYISKVLEGEASHKASHVYAMLTADRCIDIAVKICMEIAVGEFTLTDTLSDNYLSPQGALNQNFVSWEFFLSEVDTDYWAIDVYFGNGIKTFSHELCLEIYSCLHSLSSIIFVRGYLFHFFPQHYW